MIAKASSLAACLGLELKLAIGGDFDNRFFPLEVNVDWVNASNTSGVSSSLSSTSSGSGVTGSSRFLKKLIKKYYVNKITLIQNKSKINYKIINYKIK